MSTSDSPLLFGPSGWAPDPRSGSPGLHTLERLAADFDTVEIPSSRTSFLRPEVVNVWTRKVSLNPRFRFCVSLHRQFTEERNLDCDSVNRFHESLRPLQARRMLGCVIMHFPWSFRFTGENRSWLIQLRRTFSAFPLVAEMRHSSWLRDEAIGTFLDFHIGFCNLDQPKHVNAMPPASFLTSAVGYVRLTCERRDDDGRVQPAYSQEDLEDWKGRIEKISRFSTSTFVVGALSTPQASERCAMRLQAVCQPASVRRPKPVTRQPMLFPIAI